LDIAREKYTEEEVEAAKAAASIFKLFIWVSLFWALFDQQGSSWVLQAEKMDRNFLGMQLESSQIQALNPIMVMALIPIFSLGIYPLVEKMGIKVTALRKMSVGMLLAAFSFVFIGSLQYAIDAGQTVNVGWQIIPYLIITVSEIMVSITGLEFAYTQAPRSMKSTIMSFWLLTVFVGNLIAAYVSAANKFEGGNYFMFFAGLMGIVSLFFVWGAARFKVRSFIESRASAAGEAAGAGLAIEPTSAS
jgi:POT family proton-dependent oligopeptide transporter